jgi:hypothetical protein
MSCEVIVCLRFCQVVAAVDGIVRVELEDHMRVAKILELVARKRKVYRFFVKLRCGNAVQVQCTDSVVLRRRPPTFLISASAVINMNVFQCASVC